MFFGLGLPFSGSAGLVQMRLVSIGPRAQPIAPEAALNSSSVMVPLEVYVS